MGDTVDAFHAAIYDDPTNPLPRLVYADWLDDQGEAEYAELIRLEAEVDRVPRPRAERAALRRRRFEVSQAVVAGWRLDEILPARGWRWLFVNGVMPDMLEVQAAELAKWEQWPVALRPRTLRVLLGSGEEHVLTGCHYLGRVIELRVTYVDSVCAPAEPLLTGLSESPHLGRLEQLEVFGCRPVTEDLRRLAATQLARRLNRLSIAFPTGEEEEEGGHWWPINWEVTAAEPPAGAIAAALLAAAETDVPTGTPRHG